MITGQPAASYGVGALLLADARLPGGGHAHSGGIEPAHTSGVVTDLASLELFLRGRLRTSGVTAAGLASAACELAAAGPGPAKGPGRAGGPGAAAGAGGAANGPGGAKGGGLGWAELEAEADARMPSPAQRAASRQQGRALLRVARAAWPGATCLRELPRDPHHPIVVGAAAAAAGCTPGEAASIATYQSVAGPASAAVRLLGLDPIAVSAIVARMLAEANTADADGPPGDRMPFPSAVNLDLLAEFHHTTEVRLFES